MTYDDAVTKSRVPDAKNKYKCVICKNGKVFSGQGFGVHLKKVHKIANPATKKKAARNEDGLVRFCPNCGFPVGEVKDAVHILLRGKK